MSRLQEIGDNHEAMTTLANLTNVFQSLASMRIAQIKNQVLQSEEFFDELWQIYSQLRVDGLFNFGRTQHEEVKTDKVLLIVITAEGGFSGDIDQKLIKEMMREHDPKKHDIVVIGHHGATVLTQNEIKFKKYYALPSRDRNINVQPLVNEVKQYRDTVVFYQKYISLMNQQIQRITLHAAVQQQGKLSGKPEEEISDKTHIFEPSTFEVIAYLENSMTQITLGQVILDSKLAQYASRFRAMSMAHDKSDELVHDLSQLYNRTKRRLQDERIKEIVNGLRKAGV